MASRLRTRNPALGLPVAALALLLSQYGIVALVLAALHAPLNADGTFWLVPLRTLARIPDLPPGLAACIFALNLGAAGLLASLSFGRARQSGQGYALAALALVPVVQIAAVAVLASLPIRPRDEPAPSDDGGRSPRSSRGC